MDVCKCIVPLWHGDTINSRRAANPLMRLVEGEERWEAPDPPGDLPQNWGENEPNRIVTCMVLKATDNDKCHLTFCLEEFRGPRSGFCRSGGINNKKTIIRLYTLSQKIYAPRRNQATITKLGKNVVW
ncbi:uncharacterized protein TNCV_2945541 [Trichonephila clavipes]|nr:uncharacterized protein TNCV_2945541 [Trichonephila clavipes]